MDQHANYKICDNFISEKDLSNIYDIITGVNFPWYFQEKINTKHSKKDQSFYFTHLLFVDNKINSDIFNLFLPIISKLNAKSLIRVKVNCYPCTEKIQENEPHTDYDYDHKGLVYYFNTCDGYTKLSDNIKVDSISNRALFFNPALPHQSTTCTNAKARFNMNINYF
jgi:hypothetical protein